MTMRDSDGPDDAGSGDDCGGGRGPQMPRRFSVGGPGRSWRIRVVDEQVVIEAPSDGGASGYELTVSQGRALANGVIQAYALACDKREPNTRDDLSIRWFVAVVGDHIRVSVELLEPTDVYWLEDAEAVGLAMALLLACDSAERLGGVGLDDDAASLIEETLRLAGPSVSRLRNLAREDEGDDTSVGDDDDR